MEDGHNQSGPPTPQATPRRKVSAAGFAARLKDKALIEARPPLTRTSYSERTPYTSIFDPVSPTEEEPGSPAGFSTPLPRKRRISSGSDTSGEGGSKRGRRQNDDSLLRDIKELIQGSEERTVGRIDEKIDGLSDRINKRMDASKKDIKKLGRNVREPTSQEGRQVQRSGHDP